MYHNQKGFLPALLATISELLLVGYWTASAFMIFPNWYHDRAKLSLGEANSNFLISFLFMLLMFVCFVWPFILLSGSMFPALRATKKGLKYRYLGFWGGLVHWDEIDDVMELQKAKGYRAITISRKGFFLFNGLWSNTIFGILFLGQLEPILLISPSTQNCEGLLTEINAGCLAARR